MINLAVMAGVTGGGERSAVVAKLILLTYAFSVVSWTAAIAVFFRVIG